MEKHSTDNATSLGRMEVRTAANPLTVWHGTSSAEILVIFKSYIAATTRRAADRNISFSAHPERTLLTRSRSNGMPEERPGDLDLPSGRSSKCESFMRRAGRWGGLSLKFNSAKTVISRIVQGVSWAHIGGPVRQAYARSPRYTKLPVASRAAIVARYDCGDTTMQELADEHGVSLAGIHLIIKKGY